ncbi:M48 family metallopeptidase [Thioalkalivibrio sp. XN279]|uniref:tetratricopeptide repeat protein n=1 Tax=Thioalkalivibrio sp. XN279 TaxID=2714953 RepID=UPI00140ABFEA|nr:tetratricopeptide repeat protein [Thioalkalivibrio sp. XN279]NHA14888.1 tetratricopeptide repeat protein [Thioalkalivibrio sp. XN279]
MRRKSPRAAPCLAAALVLSLAAAFQPLHASENAARLDELAREAQRLSWEQRFDEALAMYAEVLAADPQHELARRERAKVLSWAKRYEESAAAFRALLAERPDDLEARVGLGKVLSWSGEYAAARREYERVLERAPDHPEALLGIAQTLAWSGDLERARHAYRRAAGAATDPTAARTGLAYLDLWQGAAAEARRTAEALAERHPDSPEVQQLLRATRDATAPWMAASWDRLDDSDDNLFTTARIEAGTTLRSGPTVQLSYTDYDVETLDRNGSLRSLQGTVGYSPARGHSLQAMLGVDRLESQGFDSANVTDWGLRWNFALPETWRGTLDARREPFRYSVPLIDNRIVIESLTFAANGPLGPRWRLSGTLSSWRLSDDNQRLSADLGLRQRLARGAHTLEAGLNLRLQDWDKDLDNGYFDPSDFRAWGVVARAFGPVAGPAGLDYDVSAEFGLQSFDSQGLSTSNDRYYLLTARLGWQATPYLRVEGFADGGSYASQGGAEWSYFRIGIQLRRRFGSGTP